MQLSNNPLNKTIEKQLSEMMYGILAELKTPEDVKMVMNDVLTDGERIAIGDVEVNGGCDSGPFKIIKPREPEVYTILEPIIKER